MKSGIGACSGSTALLNPSALLWKILRHIAVSDDETCCLKAQVQGEQLSQRTQLRPGSSVDSAAVLNRSIPAAR